ncbi:mucin-19-like [Lineus longissimus]|uniref:mucin-19-like n=1 Tax=Lineus longissimus TaxID=88925 RepID=UPI002B4E99B1
MSIPMMWETLVAVAAVCVAAYYWWSASPGQESRRTRQANGPSGSFLTNFNFKNWNIISLLNRSSEAKFVSPPRRLSVSMQASSASPAFNPRLGQRLSTPGPSASLLKNTSFTALLNRTADARMHSFERRSGSMTPQSPAWASPRNKINPFLRSPDFSGPVIYQSPPATPPIGRCYPTRVGEPSPTREPTKFVLNTESTRNTGSPCTQRITVSSPPSCLRRPPLGQPVTRKTPPEEPKRSGKRAREVDPNPVENSPRREKALKTTDERVQRMSLKRPPLREETQAMNVLKPNKRVRGLNSIEASLTSSKRARDRVTSPEDRTPTEKRSRKETLSNVVKILEASIVENAMELSKKTPDQIMGLTAEHKPPDIDSPRGRSGSVPRGTPKRLVTSMMKEKDSPGLQQTTPKRVRKQSVAKTSPSSSPEMPEWMKDKKSDEYKAELQRHLRNKERDEQLAKERLEAMLRVIDGEDEKESAVDPSATSTTQPAMPPVMPALTRTTSVLTTSPTTGVQGTAVTPTTIVITTSTISASASFRPTFLTSSPQLSTTGTKMTSKTSPKASGLSSALKQVKSLTSPTNTAKPRAALNSSLSTSASPAIFTSQTSASTGPALPVSTPGIPQQVSGFSFGAAQLNPSTTSVTSNASGSGFTIPGQPSFPAAPSKPEPSSTANTTSAQGLPQVSGLTFSAQASAPNSLSGRAAEQKSGFAFSTQAPVTTSHAADKPSFRQAFGPSPTKSQVPASTGQTTTTQQTSGFSFSAEPSSAAAQTLAGFGFSAQTSSAAPGQAPSSAQSTKAASVAAPGGFSFNATTPAANPASSASTAANLFGSAPPAYTPSSTGFSLGGAPSTSAASSSGFSFGAHAPTSAVTTGASLASSQTTQASSGFSFGAQATTTAASSGFSFGQTAAAPPSYGQATAAAPTPAFGSATSSTSAAAFGQATTSAATTAFGQTAAPAFGQTTPAVSSSTSAFGGQKPSATAFGQSSAPVASVFGATTNPTALNLTTGSARQKPGSTTIPFSLGAKKPAGSAASSSGFSFSAQAVGVSTPAKAPAGFGFQAPTAAPASNPFNAAPAKSSASSAGFTFGAAAPSTASSSGFSFGAQTPSAVATPKASSGFNFSGQAATTATSTASSGFSFGGTTPAAPAFGQSNPTAPAFGQAAAPAFGQTSSAPAFGQSTPAAPTFGGAANMTKQMPAVPVFGQSTPAAPAFGQASSAPAFGQSTPSTPGFGQSAPAPAFVGAPSTPVFNVGTGSAAPKPRTVKARRRMQRK